MVKYSTSKSSKVSSGKKYNKDVKTATAGGFKDRNLMGVSPLKEQFEPTDATPINQHKRMAGAG